MTLFFFCILLFAKSRVPDFLKVPDPKKISGRPDKLEQWVQIDWASLFFTAGIYWIKNLIIRRPLFSKTFSDKKGWVNISHPPPPISGSDALAVMCAKVHKAALFESEQTKKMTKIINFNATFTL